MRFFGKGQEERAVDPPFSEKQAYEVPISADDLKWELSLSGLTTQYKSFYFTFSDGSAGYLQIAYGNLGVLVKVAPLGFSYYCQGHEAIVASHTLRAGSMKVSEDRFSLHVAQHSLVMHDDHGGWQVVIEDPQLSYNLRFRIDSEIFTVHDFGRKLPEQNFRHKFVPKLVVSGTVRAHGETKQVTGFGTYIEAYYTHVKFTDSCNEFVNFQLRSHDSNEVLTLMQYIPRAGTSAGPFITHGSYMKDGKVVAVCFGNSMVAKGTILHSDSGYSLPTQCENTWSGKTVDGRSFRATCSLELKQTSSVTDVLSIFPKFFKDIVSIWAGLPYVFCWRIPETIAKIEIDGITHEFRGLSSTELTKVHKPYN